MLRNLNISHVIWILFKVIGHDKTVSLYAQFFSFQNKFVKNTHPQIQFVILYSTKAKYQLHAGVHQNVELFAVTIALPYTPAPFITAILCYHFFSNTYKGKTASSKY
jgi:hypothetical protein